jgi:hypothetical protein
MSARLQRYLKEIDMSDLTEAQDRLAWRAEDALNAVVMKQLDRFEEWREALTELARQIRYWETAAKAAAIRESLAKEVADG